MKKKILILSLILIFSVLAGCTDSQLDEEDEDTPLYRSDGSYKVDIPIGGSLQNPAFSPDGNSIVFTRFRNGYNEEPADIFIFNLEDKNLDTLVMNGNCNVNLPGACWNSVNNNIAFSSSRDPHDEIFMISENGKNGDEIQLTDRRSFMAYEPSFSPDGQWIVFESHPVDVEEEGVIMRHRIDESITYQALTDASDDCRQPNWSPANNYILFQKLENQNWDIWIMNIDGNNKEKVTTSIGDDTDACFTNDGNFIIFSADGDLQFANIYQIPVSGGTPIRLTNYNDGYDGAPSISADGTKLAFESCEGNPDDSDGTSIWILNIKG
jgi:TolB protein